MTSSRPFVDHYKFIGLPKNATKATIKTRVKELSMDFHPDKQKDDATRAEVLPKMQKVNAAREILLDDEKRRAYDYDYERGRTDARLAELKKEEAERRRRDASRNASRDAERDRMRREEAERQRARRAAEADPKTAEYRAAAAAEEARLAEEQKTKTVNDYFAKRTFASEDKYAKGPMPAPNYTGTFGAHSSFGAGKTQPQPKAKVDTANSASPHPNAFGSSTAQSTSGFGGPRPQQSAFASSPNQGFDSAEKTQPQPKAKVDTANSASPPPNAFGSSTAQSTSGFGGPRPQQSAFASAPNQGFGFGGLPKTPASAFTTPNQPFNQKYGIPVTPPSGFGTPPPPPMAGFETPRPAPTSFGAPPTPQSMPSSHFKRPTTRTRMSKPAEATPTSNVSAKPENPFKKDQTARPTQPAMPRMDSGFRSRSTFAGFPTSTSSTPAWQKPEPQPVAEEKPKPKPVAEEKPKPKPVTEEKQTAPPKYASTGMQTRNPRYADASTQTDFPETTQQAATQTCETCSKKRSRSTDDAETKDTPAKKTKTSEQSEKTGVKRTRLDADIGEDDGAEVKSAEKKARTSGGIEKAGVKRSRSDAGMTEDEEAGEKSAEKKTKTHHDATPEPPTVEKHDEPEVSKPRPSDANATKQPTVEDVEDYDSEFDSLFDETESQKADFEDDIEQTQAAQESEVENEQAPTQEAKPGAAEEDTGDGAEAGESAGKGTTSDALSQKRERIMAANKARYEEYEANYEDRRRSEFGDGDRYRYLDPPDLPASEPPADARPEILKQDYPTLVQQDRRLRAKIHNEEREDAIVGGYVDGVYVGRLGENSPPELIDAWQCLMNGNPPPPDPTDLPAEGRTFLQWAYVETPVWRHIPSRNPLVLEAAAAADQKQINEPAFGTSWGSGKKLSAPAASSTPLTGSSGFGRFSTGGGFASAGDACATPGASAPSSPWASGSENKWKREEEVEDEDASSDPDEREVKRKRA